MIGTGTVRFILLSKRFDNGRLTWPRTSEEAKGLDSQQFDLLLKGLNYLPQPKVHRTKKAHFIENFSLLEVLPTDMLHLGAFYDESATVDMQILFVGSRLDDTEGGVLYANQKTTLCATCLYEGLENASRDS